MTGHLLDDVVTAQAGGRPVGVTSVCSAHPTVLEVALRRYVARVLEATAGNKTLAARILGVDRKTLYRKIGSVPEPIE